MSGGGPEPSPALLSGIQNLRSVTGCVVEGETFFDITASRWVVVVGLAISASSEHVASRTRWCILIDEYPWGSISFYPSSRDGIVSTFPHQEYNTTRREHPAWKSGKLCLDSPFGYERFRNEVRDPVGQADSRLAWHAERAIAWLSAAAKGTLIGDGDPFEVPTWHISASPEPKKRVIHDESKDTFSCWENRLGCFGECRFGALPDIQHPLVISQFLARDGASIREWGGRELKDAGTKGYWWLWPKPIVSSPWRSPSTWGELRAIGQTMGVDVDQSLRAMLNTLRGVSDNPILLLGYPIPKYFGEDPQEIHWEAVRLPKIPAGIGQPDGFRDNELGWWMRDRTDQFNDSKPIIHVATENWEPKRLRARGEFDPSLCKANVAVIGVGALGSCVAELLARSGVKSISLIDGDVISAGNICRHMGTLDDVGQNKTAVMAKRLQSISPHLSVFCADSLPTSEPEMVALLDPHDVVIDCTASDSVLSLLSRGWWPIPRLFVSFSLGFAARRLFSFASYENSFNGSSFLHQIKPWLEDETDSWVENGEVLEGAGCWSPLFPARYDHIVQAATICVGAIESHTREHPTEPTLTVFQRSVSDSDGILAFSQVPSTTNRTNSEN